MKPSIVVIGSSNTDMTVRLDRLPRPGETLLGGEFTTSAGGKGANQAVAAARVGGEVTFVARVGRDLFGDEAVAGFQRDGINTEFVFRDPRAPSGVALIFVARDGENCIAVAGGANQRLSPADVKRARPAIAKASVVVLQLETPLETVESAVQFAARVGVRVILNPAPARALPDRLLARASILTPNETEAERLTGIAVTDNTSASRAAAKLLRTGAQAAIITLGARGAWVATPDRQELVPSFAVNALDTTAAGDVFNGALAVALAEEKPLLEAVRLANAAAAISVTRLGAQRSAPRRREVAAWLTGRRPSHRPGSGPDAAPSPGDLGQPRRADAASLHIPSQALVKRRSK